LPRSTQLPASTCRTRQQSAQCAVVTTSCIMSLSHRLTSPVPRYYMLLSTSATACQSPGSYTSHRKYAGLPCAVAAARQSHPSSNRPCQWHCTTFMRTCSVSATLLPLAVPANLCCSNACS
jgi:hypothetical protein